MDVFIIIGGCVVVAFILLFIFFVISSFTQKGMERQLTRMGNSVAKAQNNIINNNENILKESADKTANIHKDAVETIAHSIKEGFSEKGDVFCKYCGAQIDEDSNFCKKCGKQL